MTRKVRKVYTYSYGQGNKSPGRIRAALREAVLFGRYYPRSRDQAVKLRDWPTPRNGDKDREAASLAALLLFKQQNLKGKAT